MSKTAAPKSIIKVPHSKGCFAKGGHHEWSGLTDGHYWGNAYGNDTAKHGCNHIWIRVTCNDPNCPAIKAVHSSILIEA